MLGQVSTPYGGAGEDEAQAFDELLAYGFTWDEAYHMLGSVGQSEYYGPLSPDYTYPSEDYVYPFEIFEPIAPLAPLEDYGEPIYYPEPEPDYSNYDFLEEARKDPTSALYQLDQEMQAEAGRPLTQEEMEQIMAPYAPKKSGGLLSSILDFAKGIEIGAGPGPGSPSRQTNPQMPLQQYGVNQPGSLQAGIGGSGSLILVGVGIALLLAFKR